jgi:hypothetical protein
MKISILKVQVMALMTQLSISRANEQALKTEVDAMRNELFALRNYVAMNATQDHDDGIITITHNREIEDTETKFWALGNNIGACLKLLPQRV